MHLNALDWTLWILVIASQGAVAIRMMASGAWRKWPALFAFLCTLTLKDLVRVMNALLVGGPYIDFYTFWFGSFAAECIEVWMIVEIGLSLGGISKRARKLICYGLPALAGVFVAGTMLFAFHHNLPRYERLYFVAERLDMAVGLAWLACFLVLAICSEIIGIEWSNGVRGIASGFTLELLSATYIGWLIVHEPSAIITLANIKSAVYLVSLAVWAASTGRPKPRKAHSSLLSQMQRYLEAYKRLFEKLEVGEVND